MPFHDFTFRLNSGKDCTIPKRFIDEFEVLYDSGSVDLHIAGGTRMRFSRGPLGLFYLRSLYEGWWAGGTPVAELMRAILEDLRTAQFPGDLRVPTENPGVASLIRRRNERKEV